MNLRIAILGTRGIPNRYGGFEQAAEYLSEGLAASGHEVTVYNSHRHPCREKNWKGVKRIHCFDPEYLLNTAGQFFYDLNCIMDARKRDFDIVLFLGYTSSSVWYPFFPRNAVIVSNMDGMEWKRSKYGPLVRRFLKKAEALAVKHSHFLIADAPGIRDHLSHTYDAPSACIAYGALKENEENEADPGFGLSEKTYYMLMARMEPENNIDTILSGFHQTNSPNKFLVVGNTRNRYGRKIVKKFSGDDRIIFAGSLFDQLALHRLRQHALIYFHGHSVGGTNPSLLEAMSSRAFIAAHDNVFNRDVLGDDAVYFKTSGEVLELIQEPINESLQLAMKQNNQQKLEQHYRWPHIVRQYENYLTACYQKKKHGSSIPVRRYAYE